MTTTAHNKRRFHGSKDEPTHTPVPRNNLYRELHPEMFANIPSSKIAKPEPVKRPPRQRPDRRDLEPLPTASLTMTETIIMYLWNNKPNPATAPQIAKATGLRPDSVARRLNQGIDGLEVKDRYVPDRGKPIPLWGVVEDGVS
jgi:hypothetical protein